MQCFFGVGVGLGGGGVGVGEGLEDVGVWDGVAADDRDVTVALLGDPASVGCPVWSVARGALDGDDDGEVAGFGASAGPMPEPARPSVEWLVGDEEEAVREAVSGFGW